MRAKKLIFGTWLLGVLVVIALLFVAPISLRAYDASHPVTVECVVHSAVAGDGTSRSARGVGATYNQVRIESPDCGTVFIREQVTASNAPRIAAEFHAGATYEFIVGAASYRFRDQLRAVNQSIEVQRPA